MLKSFFCLLLVLAFAIVALASFLSLVSPSIGGAICGAIFIAVFKLSGEIN